MQNIRCDFHRDQIFMEPDVMAERDPRDSNVFDQNKAGTPAQLRSARRSVDFE